MTKPLKLVSLVILAALALPYGLFMLVEATTASAANAADEILVNLAVGTTISISSPSDVNLGTITGSGSALATSTWSVITNNSGGYNIDIKSDTTPSMKCYGGGCAVNSDSIADYTPASVNVPETWSVAATDAEFGITTGGTAASSTFSNGGKFYNLTTVYRSIGGQTISTTGTDVPVGFKVEIGATKVQPTGNYRATTTMQVTTL